MSLRSSGLILRQTSSNDSWIQAEIAVSPGSTCPAGSVYSPSFQPVLCLLINRILPS